MRRLTAPLAVSLASILQACGGTPTPIKGTAPSASAAVVEAPRGCDVAAMEAKGDLDGVLAALDRCPESSLAERMRRVDILVTLGDLALAKASAAEVAQRARGAGAEGESIRSRADAVLALESGAPRAKGEELVEAHALIDKARTEREPARWIDLARARHAIARATGAPGKPVLVARDSGQSMAGDRVLFQVTLRDVPDGDNTSGTAVVEVDPRSGALRAVRLISPGVRLDQSRPLAVLPGEPNAFIAQTDAGIRTFFSELDRPAIPRRGALTMSPDGKALVVDLDSEVTVIDVASWSERFTHHGQGGVLGRVTDDAFTLLAPDVSGTTERVALATGTSLLESRGAGALSADGRTLAVLSDDSGRPEGPPTFRLHLHGIDRKPTERVVSITTLTGFPSVGFDDKGHAMVSEYSPAMHSCILETRALVDVDTGKTLKIPKEQAYRDCPGSGASIELAPTASGLTASAASYSSDAQLVVSKNGVVVQRVPLAMNGGFNVTTIIATPDERFVLACGSGAAVGAFVVDVATGRTTFLSDIQDCSESVFRGARIVGTLGVRDLGSDQGSPDWPSLARPPFLGLSELAEISRVYVPTRTPGLHCRFDDVLEPYEVCGPPPPPPGH